MGKKGKGKNRKGNQKHQHLKRLEEEAVFGSTSYHVCNESDQETSDEGNSRYSAKAVNCEACLKPKDERRHPYKPDVKEIVDLFRKKRPTVGNIQRALQLLNELVDNFESPIDEIHRQGLDVMLVQGIQYQNPTIQYYALHALSIIVIYMDEAQVKSLIPQGLLTGLTATLQSDMLFIVQEAIEVCSSIIIKSAAMRDVIAACGSLHVGELLSKYYQTISTKFARVVAIFLRDLCCSKPVPEFVLKRVASSARYLLRHEENEIRVSALGAIFEVVLNKDFTLTFEDDYVELVLRFLDSSRYNEAIVKAGFIRKILSILVRNSAPKFGHDACLILTSLLSNKKYIEPVLESGLVLLLLGLMDRASYCNRIFWKKGTKSYKREACRALTCMCDNIDQKNARRLADPAYLEKMCSVLTSENNDYVICSLALLNCMFKACSKERAKRRFKLATNYVRESEAFEYITEYINSQTCKIRSLADRIYSGYLINIQLSDNDEEDPEREAG
ncbi:hypothetical protein LOAG_01546 [Loa loa]|uniref:Uncharacterized protein n=1 Tax=Loa loa TaxID=7209 RepID=A0A1S0U8Q6_LOALO|nr:hypothetical protein LOAG_01546 [Loa loa]EFO26939.2 hypothetical protein LOAG_01546 [Loa loa]